MIDFGYTINKDLQIDYDANSRSISNFILKKDQSFLLCINCGACTATCTTGQFAEFNIRKIFTLIKRGEVRGIKEQISKCQMCGKCKLVCPRGVNTRNIIYQISKAIERTEKNDF